MGYSDQKFYTRPLLLMAENVTSTATATASGHVVTNTAVEVMPAYQRRTELTGGYVIVATAPNAGATTTKIAVLNGTATAMVFTIGTLTAGQGVAPVVTAANAVVASGTAPTISVISTSTASNTVTQGNYDLYFEAVERFA